MIRAFAGGVNIEFILLRGYYDTRYRVALSLSRLESIKRERRRMTEREKGKGKGENDFLSFGLCVSDVCDLQRHISLII